MNKAIPCVVVFLLTFFSLGCSSTSIHQTDNKVLIPLRSAIYFDGGTISVSFYMYEEQGLALRIIDEYHWFLTPSHIQSDTSQLQPNTLYEGFYAGANQTTGYQVVTSPDKIDEVVALLETYLAQQHRYRITLQAILSMRDYYDMDEPQDDQTDRFQAVSLLAEYNDQAESIVETLIDHLENAE